MENIELKKLISLGHSFRYWTDYSEGFYKTWLRGNKGEQHGLLDNLQKAKNTIEELNLSQRTCEEIDEFINHLDEKYGAEDNLDENDKEFLKNRTIKWEDRILNNSEKLNVILLNNVYSLNPELLIKGAENFFSKSVWKQLSTSTTKDLNECCRCIMFELPTSAGFIALRATESVLREYYSNKTTKHLEKFIDWKTILDELKSTNADKNLLGHLDYLRNNLRNKLSHPDAFLEQKEAENIFPMIVTSIEAMQKDLS